MYVHKRKHMSVCTYYLPSHKQHLTLGKFKQSLLSLNLDLVLLLMGRITKAKEPRLPYYLSIARRRIIRFIPFIKIFGLCEVERSLWKLFRFSKEFFSISRRLWLRSRALLTLVAIVVRVMPLEFFVILRSRFMVKETMQSFIHFSIVFRIYIYIYIYIYKLGCSSHLSSCGYFRIDRVVFTR